MMNDTVREELQNKIMPVSAKLVRPPTNAERLNAQKTPSAPILRPSPPARTLPKANTAELVSPKTSPTLVEFQNKSTPIPDWRLQVQNAVQQRLSERSPVAVAGENLLPINGVAALTKEPAPAVEAAANIKITDPRIARALNRIDESRRKFLSPDAQPPKPAVQKPEKMRSFPYDVVGNSNGSSNGTAAAPALKRSEVAERPRLVSQEPATPEKRDTSKLPPIDILKAKPISKPVEAPFAESDGIADLDSHPFAKIQILSDNITIESGDFDELEGVSNSDIDDLAPFSMRFGAGLFDLIIGVFASMLILSPVAFTNSNWFTPTGAILFAATTALVLFVYMTVCLGFFGKTMGMRLFSLELVDAAENEFPSLRQAAVNSSVFIISLVFAGAGFLTVFFNEENRALHDLLSGTILVREF